MIIRLEILTFEDHPYTIDFIFPKQLKSGIRNRELADANFGAWKKRAVEVYEILK